MSPGISLPRNRRATIGRALAIGAALGAPAMAAPIASAAPAATVALLDVGDRPVHLASTFTAESVALGNASTAGETVVAFTIDLTAGPAMFPDLAFDPAGAAGDTQGKDLTLDAATGDVALAAPPSYRVPVGGGFGVLTATFPAGEDGEPVPGDLAPGEEARMSFDVDPTSIQGTPPEPVPAAAPVSGAELHGATVSVTFSDGTTLMGDLALVPGSDNSSALVLEPGSPPAQPVLARPGGRSAPAVTFDAVQGVVVSGPPGAIGVLVAAEGHLNVVDAPGGGTDLDPFEANTAAAISETAFVIGPDGRTVVEVALTDTPGATPLLPLETGINHLTAYLLDGPRRGPVSPPLVLRLDPAAERVAPAVADAFPVPGQAGVPPGQRVRVTFTEEMDPGTVTLPGAIALTGPGGSPVPAAVEAGDDAATFFLTPEAPLALGTEYTVTVTTGVADLVGNAPAAPRTWTFTTEVPPPPPAPAAPAGDPLCAPVPERPAGENAGTIRLSASQLLIGQRIAQAAVRRANAVEGWLEAGITTGDLCGNAFGPAEFAGVTWTGGAADPSVAPAPRPMPVAPATPDAGGVTLSAAQLLINQRIAQAAVRRVDALVERLQAGLTGGDLADGAVGPGKLWTGLSVEATAPAGPVARSRTPLRGRERSGGRVSLSVAQVRINQRISQAAVRRANALIDRLQGGLTGADFRDGTLTAADLAAELRPA